MPQLDLHALAERRAERQAVEVGAGVTLVDRTDVKEDKEKDKQTDGGEQTDDYTDLLTSLVNNVKRYVSAIYNETIKHL